MRKNKQKLIALSLVTMLFFAITPLHSFANHNDGSSNLWWGVSSSTERKINDLDNESEDDIVVPILLGVMVEDLDDTWGDARANGRTHEGTDIFAPRGAFIVSPTDAVVTRIDYGDTGGRVVYTANPGGELFYYAHLEDYADGLNEGDELKKGDLIGYVGNSGNASAASTHLHFAITDEDGALNSFPRMTKDWDLDGRIDAIEKIINDADDEKAQAEALVAQYRSLFLEAQSEKIDLPSEIEDALTKGVTVPASTTTVLTRDLRYGMRGADITWLQNFLVVEGKGSASLSLASAGATGYFGSLTKNAVIEYQRAVGLSADGVLGPKSRASIDSSI